MGFDVTSDAYGRFMGRYSGPLAIAFADLVDLRPGQRAVDVGCGAGALTGVLAERLGIAAVSAIDPSASFVHAVADTFPGIDVREGSAEHLPYPSDTFDAALAQLVVHFMTSPVNGLAEMARVTAPGGVVAASVWDHAGGSGPLAVFWRAARDLDPAVVDESAMPGVREGHLGQLFEEAGMTHPTTGSLSVSVAFSSFEEWWEPFTLGVGPAGEHVISLDPDRRMRLRDLCAQRTPPAPFSVDAVAWTAVWVKATDG